MLLKLKQAKPDVRFLDVTSPPSSGAMSRLAERTPLAVAIDVVGPASRKKTAQWHLPRRTSRSSKPILPPWMRRSPLALARSVRRFARSNPEQTIGVLADPRTYMYLFPRSGD